MDVWRIIKSSQFPYCYEPNQIESHTLDKRNERLLKCRCRYIELFSIHKYSFNSDGYL